MRRSVLDLIDPDDGYVASMAIASAANGVASPSRSPAGGGRRRPHRDRLDRDADRRRHRPRRVARPPLRASTSPSASDRRRRSAPPARASSRPQTRRAGARAQPPRRRPAASRRALGLAPARRVAASTPTRTGAAVIIGSPRGARRCARGAPRARSRHPPGRPHRPGPCGGRSRRSSSGRRSRSRSTMPPERLPAPVEAAAYYVVSEA